LSRLNGLRCLDCLNGLSGPNDLSGLGYLGRSVEADT
jgi:hypothetical protein